MSLTAVPAIVKILSVFVAMLAASRIGLPLGLALIGGGVALDVLGGQATAQVVADVVGALQKPLLWFFLVIVALVVEIGRFLTEARNAGAILGAIRRWGGRHGRLSGLMAIPSVMGLIPMPAGALFSAPFVEQASGESARTAEWKTAVNYLFRHTWEYWWPLYPAVIVAISVFGMETWRFIAAQFMYTPVALLTGYFFLLRPHRTALALQPDVPAGAQGRALFLALPLAIIVGASCVLPVVLRTVLPGMDPENRKMLAMLIGLAGALALIAVDERKEGNRRTFRAIIEKRSLGVIFTVGGVMIFKSMLDRSGLLPAASGELIRSGIPVAVAVATLPFLAGLVTGLGIGFTGTSFPLVVGLLNTTGSGLTPMATLVLAFGFGYVGMMLSPVHLCLVATREYFTSTLGGVYRLIAPPLLLIAVFAVLMHALFIFLGW